MVSRRDFLKGIGLVAGGIAGGTLFEMLRRYTPPNDGTPTEKHLEDNVTITTEVIATPTLENKLFEFIFPDSTPEQYKIFHDNALEDYRKVLGVYGINEKDARMVVSVGKQGYGAGFYFKGKEGVGVGMGTDDFVTDRREVRHEMAHAINHTLFPTYHTWFDEGMAILNENSNEFYTLEKGGYKQLKNDPGLWEKQKVYYGPGSANTPTHLIGMLFFSGLIEDYGLTPEKNRKAIALMHEKYLKTGQELNKGDIKQAYESALEIKLDPLFGLIGNGVKILYSLYPSLSEDMKKTMNEF